MNARAEHRKLKKQVMPIQIKVIQRSATPYLAAQRVFRKTPAEACALIDSLDPLTAAFIVNILRGWAGQGNPEASEIMRRAKRLKIQGLKGLFHAHNLVYRRTGAFAV